MTLLFVLILFYRYEEGNTTLWKVGLVSDFMQSETPVEFLGSVNALSFDDPACLSIRDHELTTDEVLEVCCVGHQLNDLFSVIC